MPVVIAMTNIPHVQWEIFTCLQKFALFLQAKQKKTKTLCKSCRQYNIVSTDTKIKLQKKGILRFLQKFAPAKIP